MDPWWMAAAAGVASGSLVAAARRVQGLAWLALVPLGLVLAVAPPAAVALAGALAGAIGAGSTVWNPTFRTLRPIATVPTALASGAAAALAALAVSRFGAGALAIGLPAIPLLGTLPIRVLGAPRWVVYPLACSQERWLLVVHAGRWGGAAFVTLVLGACSAGIVLSLRGAVVPAVACFAFVGASLAAGYASLQGARARSDSLARIRVAAVVADGAPPPDGEIRALWPTESPEYRDVGATLRRYEPQVARAAREGARVIVLPEACVFVDAESRGAWLEAVGGWARAHGVTIVAPFVDTSLPRNQLVVVDPSGVVGGYDKQHPGRNLEPPRVERTPPGPHRAVAPLSTVICVDLDYDDLVAPVRAAGGLLCAPSNDWLDGFEELHHDTGVWAAVRTGVSTIRATGHGVSSVRDGAGRVIARAKSDAGPVVLVVDAPVSA